MIGVYDYTVVLTYLSLISATVGIFVSLHGEGHPYFGIFFLMLCGFFDAFDGRVARTKKDRTKLEKDFGVQIDSLADLVAFGVLPACIGDSMLWIYPKVSGIPHLLTEREMGSWMSLVVLIVITFYVVAAMIRLAYFNATEEERSEVVKKGGKPYFEGLPVTSASLIFPLIMVFQYIFSYDITPIYFVVMLLTGVLFITKFKVPKLGLRGIMVLIGIGLVEAAILIIMHNGINVL